MVSYKESSKAVKSIRKYLIVPSISFLAGFCVELIILMFTDNKMHSSAGDTIVRQNVPNAFRILLLTFLILFAIYKRKKFVCWIKAVRQADYRLCAVSVKIFLVVTAIWCFIFLTLLSARTQLNIAYYIAAIFSGMAIAGFILYYLRRIEKLEFLFFLESMLFVTFCVFVYPPFTYGGDSTVHLTRSIEMSQSYGTNIFPEYYDLVDSSNPLLGGYLLMKSETGCL